MRFLSREWIDALVASASGQRRGTSASTDRLVVQQTVDEVPADLAEEGSVVYQIVLDEDGLDVHAGAPVTPTVTLRTSYRTAAAIAAGKESAQVAFMDGRLRVGGDIGALLARHEILAELDDVFAGVRARTKWPDRDHR